MDKFEAWRLVRSYCSKEFGWVLPAQAPKGAYQARDGAWIFNVNYTYTLTVFADAVVRHRTYDEHPEENSRRTYSARFREQLAVSA